MNTTPTASMFRYIHARVYNEQTGRKEDIVVPKSAVAIIENPLYAVINEPNSTMQRLIRKLNLLDVIDEQSGSGKLDLIIQLPYVIKTEARRQQAENRRKDIENQLSGSKYGIAYTDGTEHITQLNRSVNNNLMSQIEYLTSMLYSQLGITQSILDGTADEKTMLNYNNRTIEPIISAITNYLGDRIKLDLREPEVSGFLIKSVTGLGPVKATVNTTEVVTNDGSMFNSARLSQRNIVFQIVFVDTVYGETIEDVRQKSYKYFPAKKNVEIIIETDNRYVRTSGYVESNEPNIFSSQEGTSISIICPDPFFYSAGEDGNNVTDFYSIDPMFEFPFSNESLTEPLLVFGEIQIKTEGVITYYGDAEIGVTIYIHAIGSASNINIYNTETREVMKIDTVKLQKLTGKGIVASDDIVINTSKGDKSITLIREGVSYNILNCLDKNTDWFTLAKGDNIFAFTADSGVTNLQFRIENKVIYEGV